MESAIEADHLMRDDGPIAEPPAPKYPVRDLVADTDPRLQSPKRCGHYGHHRSDGSLCLGWVIKGLKHCKTHVGKRTDLAIAEGQVILEFSDPAKYGLGDTQVDPGEVLLRLVSQAWWRVERYAAEIARIVGEHDSLMSALTGNTYAVTEDGGTVKTGEYIRAMTVLEANERDRAFNYAVKAVAAGLAERQVAVLEQQVKLLERALVAAVEEAGLGQAVAERLLIGVERNLRLVSG